MWSENAIHCAMRPTIACFGSLLSRVTRRSNSSNTLLRICAHTSTLVERWRLKRAIPAQSWLSRQLPICSRIRRIFPPRSGFETLIGCWRVSSCHEAFTWKAFLLALTNQLRWLWGMFSCIWSHHNCLSGLVHLVLLLLCNFNGAGRVVSQLASWLV